MHFVRRFVLFNVLSLFVGSSGLTCPQNGKRDTPGTSLHHSRHGVDPLFWWSVEEVLERELQVEKTNLSVLPNKVDPKSRPLRTEVVYDTNSAFTCHAPGQTISLLGEGTKICSAAEVLTARKQILLQQIVDTALKRIRHAITPIVSTGDGELVVKSGFPDCKAPYKEFSHPLLGSGVDTHFLLFITASPVVAGEGTIAFGYPCNFAKSSFRPVIGHINLDPTVFEQGDELALLSDVVLHELIHALGWTPSLLQLRDSRSIFYGKWSHDHTVSVPHVLTDILRKTQRVTQDGASIYFPTVNNTVPDAVVMMSSENVVREAKHHYGCSLIGSQELPGLELEDWTFGLSKHTPIRVHWEKRIASGEIMNSLVEKGSALSTLTLAALQDTGFYIANYAAAEPFRYGKNAGCAFLQKSCWEWHTDPAASPYSCFEDFMIPCATEGKCAKKCSSDRTYLATCNAAHYRTQIAPQYLHASLYSGARQLLKSYEEAQLIYGCDELMDNCMVWRKESDAHSCISSTSPASSSSTSPDCTTTACDPFSIPSKHSACFEGTLHMRDYDAVDYPESGHCLPYVCLAEPHSDKWLVNVTLGHRSHICSRGDIGRRIGPFDTANPTSEQYLTKGGTLRGWVSCPDPEAICGLLEKPRPVLLLDDSISSSISVAAGDSVDLQVKVVFPSGHNYPGFNTAFMCLMFGSSTLEVSDGLFDPLFQLSCIGREMKGFDALGECMDYCARDASCVACRGVGVGSYEALSSCLGRDPSRFDLWVKRDTMNFLEGRKLPDGCKRVWAAPTVDGVARFRFAQSLAASPAAKVLFWMLNGRTTAEQTIYVTPSEPAGIVFVDLPTDHTITNSVPFEIATQTVDKFRNAVAHPESALSQCPSFIREEDLMRYRGKCYEYFKVPETLDTAIAICKARGGGLGNVRDAIHQKLFSSRGASVWAGIHVSGTHNGRYEFAAYNGAPIDYFNTEYNNNNELYRSGSGRVPFLSDPYESNTGECIEYNAVTLMPFLAVSCQDTRAFWCESSAFSTIELSSEEASLKAEPAMIFEDGRATFVATLTFSLPDICARYSRTKVTLSAAEVGTDMHTNPLPLSFTSMPAEKVVVCLNTTKVTVGHAVKATLNTADSDGAFSIGNHNLEATFATRFGPGDATPCFPTHPDSCILSFTMPTSVEEINAIIALSPPLSAPPKFLEVVAGEPKGITAQCPASVAYGESLGGAEFSLVDEYGNAVCGQREVRLATVEPHLKVGVVGAVCGDFAASRTLCETRGCVFSTPQARSLGICECSTHHVDGGAGCCCASPNAPLLAPLEGTSSLAALQEGLPQHFFCPSGEQSVLYRAQTQVGNFSNAKGICEDKESVLTSADSYRMDSLLLARATSGGELTIKVAADPRFVAPPLNLEISGPYSTPKEITHAAYIRAPTGKLLGCGSGVAASVAITVELGGYYTVRVAAAGKESFWHETGIFYTIAQNGSGAFGCTEHTEESVAETYSLCGKASFPHATLDYVQGRVYPEKCDNSKSRLVVTSGDASGVCEVQMTCNALELTVLSSHAINHRLGPDVILHGVELKENSEEITISAVGLPDGAVVTVEAREMCTPEQSLIAVWTDSTAAVAPKVFPLVHLHGPPADLKGALHWADGGYTGACLLIKIRATAPNMKTAERIVQVIPGLPAKAELYEPLPPVLQAGARFTLSLRLLSEYGSLTDSRTALCSGSIEVRATAESAWESLGSQIGAAGMSVYTQGGIARIVGSVSRAGEVRVRMSCAVQDCSICEELPPLETSTHIVPAPPAQIHCHLPQVSFTSRSRIPLTASVTDKYGNPTPVTDVSLVVGVRTGDGNLLGATRTTTGTLGTALWKHLSYTRTGDVTFEVWSEATQAHSLVGCYMDAFECTSPACEQAPYGRFVIPTSLAVVMPQLTPDACRSHCLSLGHRMFSVGPMRPELPALGCWCHDSASFRHAHERVRNEFCLAPCAASLPEDRHHCGSVAEGRRFVATYLSSAPLLAPSTCDTLTVVGGVPHRLLLHSQPCDATQRFVRSCNPAVYLGGVPFSHCSRVAVGQILSFEVALVDKGGNVADVTGVNGLSACKQSRVGEQICGATSEGYRCSVTDTPSYCKQNSWKDRAVGLRVVTGNVASLRRHGLAVVSAGTSSAVLKASYIETGCISVRAVSSGLEPSVASKLMCFHSLPTHSLSVDVPAEMTFHHAIDITMYALDRFGNPSSDSDDVVVQACEFEGGVCRNVIGELGSTPIVGGAAVLKQAVLQAQSHSVAEVAIIATIARSSASVMTCGGDLSAAAITSLSLLPSEYTTLTTTSQAIAINEYWVSAELSSPLVTVSKPVAIYIHIMKGLDNCTTTFCSTTTGVATITQESPRSNNKHAITLNMSLGYNFAQFTSQDTGLNVLLVDFLIEGVRPASITVTVVSGAPAELRFEENCVTSPFTGYAGEEFSKVVIITDKAGNAAGGWAHAIKLQACRRTTRLETVNCDVWGSPPEVRPSEGGSHASFKGLRITEAAPSGYVLLATSVSTNAVYYSDPSTSTVKTEVPLRYDTAVARDYLPPHAVLLKGSLLERAVCGPLYILSGPAKRFSLTLVGGEETITAGVPFHLEVVVQDAHGNAAVNDLESALVRVSVTQGSHALGGVSEAFVGGGVATFRHLSYTTAPEELVLTVSRVGTEVIPPPAAFSVTVLPGAACCLAVVTPKDPIGRAPNDETSPLRAGDPFDLVVVVQDALGNTLNISFMAPHAAGCSGSTYTNVRNLVETHPSELGEHSGLLEPFNRSFAYAEEEAKSALLVRSEESAGVVRETHACKPTGVDETQLYVTVVVRSHSRSCEGTACASLLGDVRRPSVKGTATFPSLTYERAECITIEANGGGLRSAVSPDICFRHNTFAKLSCTTTATTAGVDTTMGMVRGQLLDKYNNPVTTCENCFVQVEEDSTGIAAGLLHGTTTTLPDPFGVVAFRDLSYSTERSGADALRLRLVGPRGITGYCNLNSPGITIQKAYSLYCIRPPGQVIAGEPFTVEASMEKWDEGGYFDEVACPADGMCTGVHAVLTTAHGYPQSTTAARWLEVSADTRVQAVSVDGYFSFLTNLTVSGAVSLQVAPVASGVEAAVGVCAPVLVVPAPAASLTLVCPNMVASGSSLIFFAFLHDAYGNSAANPTTLSAGFHCEVLLGNEVLHRYTEPWSPDTDNIIPVLSGELQPTLSGTYTISCTATAVTDEGGPTLPTEGFKDSCQFGVYAKDAHTSRCQINLRTARAGEPFDVTGYVADMYGNTAATVSSVVADIVVLSGSEDVAWDEPVVQGLARFTTLTYTTAETVVFGVNLGTLHTVCPPLTVLPGEFSALRVVEQPRCPDYVEAGSPMYVLVHAEDKYGNVVTGQGGELYAESSVHDPQSSAALDGTFVTSFVQGKGEFKDLRYSVAEKIRIVVGGSDRVTVMSDMVCIKAASPSKLSLRKSSTNTCEIEEMLQPIHVRVHDRYGNVAAAPATCHASIGVYHNAVGGSLEWEAQTCEFISGKDACTRAPHCKHEKQLQYTSCVVDPAVTTTGPAQLFGHAVVHETGTIELDEIVEYTTPHGTRKGQVLEHSIGRFKLLDMETGDTAIKEEAQVQKLSILSYGGSDRFPDETTDPFTGASTHATNTLWRYSIDRLSWTEVLFDTTCAGCITPPKRTGHIGTMHNNELYIFGGRDETGTLRNTMHRIDLSETLAKAYEVTTFNAPSLYMATGAVYKDDIFIFGGVVENGVSSTMWHLHLLEDQPSWEALPFDVGPPGMYGAPSVLSGEVWFVLLGLVMDGVSTGKMWSINLRDPRVWHSDTADLPAGSAVAYEASQRRIVVYGGSSRGAFEPSTLVSTVSVFDIDTSLWLATSLNPNVRKNSLGTQYGSKPGGRAMFPTTPYVVALDKAFFFGGWDASTSTVWGQDVEATSGVMFALSLYGVPEPALTAVVDDGDRLTSNAAVAYGVYLRGTLKRSVLTEGVVFDDIAVLGNASVHYVQLKMEVTLVCPAAPALSVIVGPVECLRCSIRLEGPSVRHVVVGTPLPLPKAWVGPVPHAQEQIGNYKFTVQVAHSWPDGSVVNADKTWSVAPTETEVDDDMLLFSAIFTAAEGQIIPQVAPATVWLRVTHDALGTIGSCSSSELIAFNVIPEEACQVSFADTPVEVTAGEDFHVSLTLYDAYGNVAFCGVQEDMLRVPFSDASLVYKEHAPTYEACRVACEARPECMMWNYLSTDICSMYDNSGHSQTVDSEGSATGLRGVQRCNGTEIVVNSVKHKLVTATQTQTDHALGTTRRDEALLFLGCYAVPQEDSYNDKESCASCCKANGASHIAVQASGPCSCLNSLPESLHESCTATSIRVYALDPVIKSAVTSHIVELDSLWHNTAERLILEAVFMQRPLCGPFYTSAIVVTSGEPHHLVPVTHPTGVAAPDCAMLGPMRFVFYLVDFWGNKHLTAKHKVGLGIREGSGTLSGQTTVVTAKGLAVFEVGYDRADVVSFSATDFDLLPESCKSGGLGCVTKVPSADTVLQGTCWATCADKRCRHPSPTIPVAYTSRFHMLAGPPNNLVIDSAPTSIASSEVMSLHISLRDSCGNKVCAQNLGLFNATCLNGVIEVTTESVSDDDWEMLSPPLLIDGSAILTLTVRKAGEMVLSLRLSGCNVATTTSGSILVEPGEACCTKILRPEECSVTSLPRMVVGGNKPLNEIVVAVVDRDGNIVKTDEPEALLLGCYHATDADAFTYTDQTETTLDLCLEECFNRGYEVFALEAGHHCLCRHGPYSGYKPLPSRDCAMTCHAEPFSTEKYWCGGSAARQVYLIGYGHDVSVDTDVGRLVGGPVSTTHQGLSNMNNVVWVPEGKAFEACRDNATANPDCTPKVIQLEVTSPGLQSSSCLFSVGHKEVVCSAPRQDIRVGEPFDIEAYVVDHTGERVTENTTLSVVDTTFDAFTMARGELSNALGTAPSDVIVVNGETARIEGLQYNTHIEGKDFAVRTFHVTSSDAEGCTLTFVVSPGQVTSCELTDASKTGWHLAGEPFTVSVQTFDSERNPSGESPTCLFAATWCATLATPRGRRDEERFFEANPALTAVIIAVEVRIQNAVPTLYNSDSFPIEGGYSAWDSAPTGDEIEDIRLGKKCAVLYKDTVLRDDVATVRYGWRLSDCNAQRLCAGELPCRPDSVWASGAYAEVESLGETNLVGDTVGFVVNHEANISGLRHLKASHKTEFTYSVYSPDRRLLCKGTFPKIFPPNKPRTFSVTPWSVYPITGELAPLDGIGLCLGCQDEAEFALKVSVFDSLGNAVTWMHPDQGWSPDEYVGDLHLRVKEGEGTLTSFQRRGLVRSLTSGSVTFGGLSTADFGNLALEVVAPTWPATTAIGYVAPTTFIKSVPCYPKVITVVAPKSVSAGELFVVTLLQTDKHGNTVDPAVRQSSIVSSITLSTTGVVVENNHSSFTVNATVAGSLTISASYSYSTFVASCAEGVEFTEAVVEVRHAAPAQLEVIAHQASAIEGHALDVGIRLQARDQYSNPATNTSSHELLCSLTAANFTADPAASFQVAAHGASPVTMQRYSQSRVHPTLYMHTEGTFSESAKSTEPSYVWFRRSFSIKADPGNENVEGEVTVSCTRTEAIIPEGEVRDLTASVPIKLIPPRVLWVVSQQEDRSCPAKVGDSITYRVRAGAGSKANLVETVVEGTSLRSVYIQNGANVTKGCNAVVNRTDATQGNYDAFCTIDFATAGAIDMLMFEEASDTPTFSPALATQLPIVVVAGCPTVITAEVLPSTIEVMQPSHSILLLKDAAGNVGGSGVVITMKVSGDIAMECNSRSVLGLFLGTSRLGFVIFACTPHAMGEATFAFNIDSFTNSCDSGCDGSLVPEYVSPTLLVTAGTAAKCVVRGYNSEVTAGQSRPSVFNVQIQDAYGNGVCEVPRGASTRLVQTSGKGVLSAAMDDTRIPQRAFPASIPSDALAPCTISTLSPPATICLTGLAPGTSLPRPELNEFTLEMWAKFPSLSPQEGELIMMQNTQFKWYTLWVQERGEHYMRLEVPPGNLLVYSIMDTTLVDSWHAYSATFIGNSKTSLAVGARLYVDGEEKGTFVSSAPWGDLGTPPTTPPFFEIRMPSALVYDIRVYGKELALFEPGQHPPGGGASVHASLQVRILTSGLDTGSTGFIVVQPEGARVEPAGDVILSADTPDTNHLGSLQQLYSSGVAGCVSGADVTAADTSGYTTYSDVWYSIAPDVVDVQCDARGFSTELATEAVTVSVAPGFPHDIMCGEQTVVGVTGSPFQSSVVLVDESRNRIPCAMEDSNEQVWNCRNYVSTIAREGTTYNPFQPSMLSSVAPDQVFLNSFEIAVSRFKAMHVISSGLHLRNGGGELHRERITEENITMPITEFGITEGADGWDATASGRNTAPSFTGNWVAASSLSGLTYEGMPISAIEGEVYFYSQVSAAFTAQSATMRYIAETGAAITPLAQYVLRTRISYVSTGRGKQTEDRAEVELRYLKDDKLLVKVKGTTHGRPRYPTWGWVAVPHTVPIGSTHIHVVLKCIKGDPTSSTTGVEDCRVAFDGVEMVPAADQSIILKYSVSALRDDGSAMPSVNCGPLKLVTPVANCADGTAPICSDGSEVCYTCTDLCHDGEPRCSTSDICHISLCNYHGHCKAADGSIDESVLALLEHDPLCLAEMQYSCSQGKLSEDASKAFAEHCGENFCATLPDMCTCFDDDVNGHWTGALCDLCITGYLAPDCVHKKCTADSCSNTDDVCGATGACTSCPAAAESIEIQSAMYFNSSYFMRLPLHGTGKANTTDEEYTSCQNVLTAYHSKGLGRPDHGVYQLKPNACTQSGKLAYCRFFEDSTGLYVGAAQFAGVWGGDSTINLAVLKANQVVAPTTDAAEFRPLRRLVEGEAIFSGSCDSTFTAGLHDTESLVAADGSRLGGAFWTVPLISTERLDADIRVIFATLDASEWVSVSKTDLIVATKTAYNRTGECIALPIRDAQRLNKRQELYAYVGAARDFIGIFAECGATMVMWYGEGYPPEGMSLHSVTPSVRLFLGEVPVAERAPFPLWADVHDMSPVVRQRMLPDSVSYRVSSCCEGKQSWRDYLPRSWRTVAFLSPDFIPEYGHDMHMEFTFGKTTPPTTRTADVDDIEIHLIMASDTEDVRVGMQLEFSNGHRTVRNSNISLFQTETLQEKSSNKDVFSLTGVTTALVCFFECLIWAHSRFNANFYTVTKRGLETYKHFSVFVWQYDEGGFVKKCILRHPHSFLCSWTV